MKIPYHLPSMVLYVYWNKFLWMKLFLLYISKSIWHHVSNLNVQLQKSTWKFNFKFQTSIDSFIPKCRSFLCLVSRELRTNRQREIAIITWAAEQRCSEWQQSQTTQLLNTIWVKKVFLLTTKFFFVAQKCIFNRAVKS